MGEDDDVRERLDDLHARFSRFEDVVSKMAGQVDDLWKAIYEPPGTAGRGKGRRHLRLVHPMDGLAAGALWVTDKARRGPAVTGAVAVASATAVTVSAILSGAGHPARPHVASPPSSRAPAVPGAPQPGSSPGHASKAPRRLSRPRAGPIRPEPGQSGPVILAEAGQPFRAPPGKGKAPGPQGPGAPSGPGSSSPPPVHPVPSPSSPPPPEGGGGTCLTVLVAHACLKLPKPL